MRDRVFDGQHSLAIEAIAERFALHERHHIVEEIAGHARVVQTEDVRVLQLRGETDLALEPLGAEGRGEVGMSTLIATSRPCLMSFAR